MNRTEDRIELIMENELVIELINKEDLNKYHIVDAPVDHSFDLRRKLENALRLGNEFKSKASIVFMTEEGAKRIETTVWSLTEKYLQIKAGVLLPLSSLIAIDY